MRERGRERERERDYQEKIIPKGVDDVDCSDDDGVVVVMMRTSVKIMTIASLL